MDFFIPSLFVFLISIIIVFAVVPKFGPTAMLVISIALLVLAVSHHITMFKSDYTSSTWPMMLKAYGPYIVMVMLLLFILSFIFSSYGGPAVPVPNNLSIPTAGSVASTANSIINTITNKVNSVINTVTPRNNTYSNGAVRKSYFNVI